MHRKAAPRNIHKEEGTGGTPELKICQTGTTHGMLVKHLVLLITFIELGYNAVISWDVCPYPYTYLYICKAKSNFCLPKCASILPALLMCCSPGEDSEVCGPYQPME